MAESKSLAQAILEYEAALKRLESHDPPLSSADVLNVLLRRDTLQALLSERSELLSDDLIDIEDLDQCLRQQKTIVLQSLKLADWRSRLEPSEKHWWWFFPSRWEKLDWLWNALTIVALTISLSLVVNTSTRILSGGAKSTTTLAVVAQSVLTLLAGGGALTEVGKKSFEKTLIRLRIPKEFWQEISCGLAWMLMLSLLGINAYLPTWAIAANRSGIENFNNQRIESAKADFERAIAMRPDYAEAYYNLGWLYENLNDLNKAKEQYEWAVQADPQKLINPITYLKANNNLGRLYILKKEYGVAVQFLNRGLTAIEQGVGKENAELKQVHYSLLKNMGWARLLQERYPESRNKLKKAIQLDETRSAAHCLIGQVWEKENNQVKAKEAWQKCLATEGNLSNPEEDDWYGLANKRLNQLSTKEEGK